MNMKEMDEKEFQEEVTKIVKKHSGDKETLELIKLAIKYVEWERMTLKEGVSDIITTLEECGYLDDYDNGREPEAPPWSDLD